MHQRREERIFSTMLARCRNRRACSTRFVTAFPAETVKLFFEKGTSERVRGCLTSEL